MQLTGRIIAQSSWAPGEHQPPQSHGLGLTWPPPQFWSPVLKICLNNPWQEPHEVPVTGSDVTRNIEAGPGLC